MINPKFNPIFRPSKRVTLMSVFINNSWVFSDPNAYISYPIDDFSRIALIRDKFGILYNDETDPSNTYMVGEPNDYLIIDFEGNLSIMTKEKYKQLYRA